MPGTYLSGLRRKSPLRRLAEINIEKYGKPPTWEMIQKVIDMSGMKMMHFEKYFGMPYNTLVQIKDPTTARQLSAQYWSDIYEQIIPEYGVKYRLVEIDKFQEIEEPKPKKILKNKEAKIIKIETDGHGRLNRVK